MPEAAHPSEESERIARLKEEFLFVIQSKPPWRSLRNITSAAPHISFIPELKEGFKYHLRRGDMDTAVRCTAIKMGLHKSDLEQYDEIDFYGIVKEVAREALVDGNVGLLSDLQKTYGNGESILGSDPTSIRETFIASVGVLRDKLAKITGAEDLLPSREKVESRNDKMFTED